LEELIKVLTYLSMLHEQNSMSYEDGLWLQWVRWREMMGARLLGSKTVSKGKMVDEREMLGER
jgi:hypothetical protein